MQQELYTLIQTRLKEAEITQAMEDPTVRVADAAVVPRPSRAPRSRCSIWRSHSYSGRCWGR